MIDQGEYRAIKRPRVRRGIHNRGSDAQQKFFKGRAIKLTYGCRLSPTRNVIAEEAAVVQEGHNGIFKIIC